MVFFIWHGSASEASSWRLVCSNRVPIQVERQVQRYPDERPALVGEAPRKTMQSFSEAGNPLFWRWMGKWQILLNEELAALEVREWVAEAKPCAEEEWRIWYVAIRHFDARVAYG
jgi:hypothetical protein